MSHTIGQQGSQQRDPSVSGLEAQPNQPNAIEGHAPESVAIDRPMQGALGSVYAPIEQHLQAVEAILKSELTSETPWVDQLLEHSWLLGGKRLRPAFVLLTAGQLGTIEPAHLQLAAALEMVHTATLVHDDILDEAETRRHEPTANSKWGNKVSVLLGDYLFTHAFHVASLSGSADAVRLLAASSNLVCEGEMRQNHWRGNFELSEPDYLQMVSDKTAELCACACEGAAMLSGATPDVAKRFRDYGLRLGVAFQIIDDVLDVAGDQQVVGKTLGTDLLNQKPTLPVIHCLANCAGKEREALLSILMSDEPAVESVLPFLAATGSIKYARSVARSNALAAQEFAAGLGDDVCAVSLRQIADFVLQRAH